MVEPLREWAAGNLPLVGSLMLGTTGLGGWLTLWLGRRKPGAEADSLVIGASEKVLKMQADLLDGVHREMQVMQARLMGEIGDLRVELATAEEKAEAQGRELVKLKGLYESLKDVLYQREDWARRTVSTLYSHFPDAYMAVRPIPEWMTDPGIPVVRRDPPDDGQPEDVS